MPGSKGHLKYARRPKRPSKYPAKFAKPWLSRNLHAYPRLNGCIYVYPTVEWEKVEEKLRNLLRNDPTNLYYLRATLTNTADVQMDNQGRITIPLI
jgi:DNA-binding transcriptional regulator/RsmH inhibitor MraZ